MKINFEWILRAHPSELTKGVWFQEEARAERLANLIRMVYSLMWLVATIPAVEDQHIYSHMSNVGNGSLWLIFSISYHFYLIQRPYTSKLKYVSTTIDIIITTGILFVYHYDMGYSTSLKAPPFMTYMLILALAALRFKAYLPIYGAIVVTVLYGSLFIWMVVTQDVEFGLPIELFTTHKISLLYQIYRLLYIVTFTILTIVLVSNARRLVHLRVKEAEQLLLEKTERKKTRSLFERYFTPKIAKYLTDHPQNMGGQMKHVTVVLTDLRGFTSLSEMLGPADSVSLLNNIFEKLVKIVFQYKGTLDKFTGDGMLLVFGVPDSSPDDALRAIQASQEMVREIHSLSTTEYKLDIGVAVHTGDVIFGNIGSSQRMELTVIGDTVNTVSRMEPLNKEFGTNIIISETTYYETKGHIKVEELPSKKLRGKSEEIRLYTIKV